MKKDVALVLSSGGPRGFAFIGAIEELLSQGFRITSVAGTSAGALVGGIYAAGGLNAFKEWLFGLDPLKVVTLMDPAFSRSGLMKGERVIEAIKKRVPDVLIESLPIPFTAISTDLCTGEEVISEKGPLFDAIRASISIPSMFQPVSFGGRTLIDGGVSNTFPLNRVRRNGRDILIGFDVNETDKAIAPDENKMVGILDRSFSLMNRTIARQQIALTPPDILIEMPFDSFSSIADYGHAREIVAAGAALTAAALDLEMKRNPTIFV